MTVSVCMIVKNEEKLLRRCLDSLAGIYDELVIVDTGSTDRTKEIAWEYTDEVYDFEWVNDFAAARNFAFSKCTKDYIYSADADEVLDDKQREMLKVLMQYLDPKYEIVNMWYLTPIDFNEANGFEREYRQKMFKRLRSWTWIDPVHESMRLEPLVFDSDIVIRHLPVDSHEGRDCAIFEKAISRGEILSPKMHGLYARELYLNGSKEDLIRAKEYFESKVRNIDIMIRPDEEPESPKAFHGTLWEKEVMGISAKDPAEEAADVDWNMYRESLCVLAKIARVEQNMKELYEVAMFSLASGPCSEICLEVGIGYYNAGDYVNASNWLRFAKTNTSPVMDPDACSKKPDKYLDIINT